MKRTFLAFGLVASLLLSSGCNSKPHTVLSGGKPPDYWVQALASKDAKQRKLAVAKLGNAGAEEADAVPALIQALKDPEVRVRREAVLALAKVGPEAKQAIPELVAMQQRDKDAQVRSNVTVTLKKLQP